MLTRPWVTPEEVREYTSFDDVKARNDAQLAADILRAEQAVIAYTHNRFDDPELTELPAPVKQAIILIAERYAHIAHQTSRAYKSETLDDWSYALNESSTSLDDLGLGYLLDDFKLAQASGKIFMRLRRL